MKKRNSQRRRDDPIAQYREWVDNRYNPGHWLGGNIPPATRNLWSSKDRRWLGAVYVGASVIGLGWAFRDAADWTSFFLVGLGVSPFLVPGLIMLFAGDGKTHKSN